MKRNTKSAKFSVITPKQSKFIRPVNTAIFSVIPQSDSNPTAYLNELLRKNKLEQQNNTFWFPTPENPGKTKDHTPIQTRILQKLIQLKDKEKINLWSITGIFSQDGWKTQPIRLVP